MTPEVRDARCHEADGSQQGGARSVSPRGPSLEPSSSKPTAAALGGNSLAQGSADAFDLSFLERPDLGQGLAPAQAGPMRCSLEYAAAWRRLGCSGLSLPINRRSSGPLQAPARAAPAWVPVGPIPVHSLVGEDLVRRSTASRGTAGGRGAAARRGPLAGADFAGGKQATGSRQPATGDRQVGQAPAAARGQAGGLVRVGARFIAPCTSGRVGRDEWCPYVAPGNEHDKPPAARTEARS